MKSDLGADEVCYVIEGRLPRALPEGTKYLFCGRSESSTYTISWGRESKKRVFVLPMFLIHMDDNLN